MYQIEQDILIYIFPKSCSDFEEYLNIQYSRISYKQKVEKLPHLDSPADLENKATMQKSSLAELFPEHSDNMQKRLKKKTTIVL